MDYGNIKDPETDPTKQVPSSEEIDHLNSLVDDGWDLHAHQRMSWRVGDRLEVWGKVYVIDCVYGPYDCHRAL